MVDKKKVESGDIAQFCTVTGASVEVARKFLQGHKRLDVAIDEFYNNPNAYGKHKGDASAPSTSKLTQLFENYKDSDSDGITIDGTIKLCEDLEVNPEDVVLLAVAYELKSPRVGEWTRQGWMEGWRNIGVDSISGMKSALSRLRDQLATDPAYFKKVYTHTFDFARSEGQRSLGLETAQAFWALLLPHGFEGGALIHSSPRGEDDDDVPMSDASDCWKAEYNDWWFDFLNQSGGKGVSKDTWIMFLDFVRSIDSKFSNYDIEAAWPSTIDDFVEYAKARLASGA